MNFAFWKEILCVFYKLVHKLTTMNLFLMYTKCNVLPAVMVDHCRVEKHEAKNTQKKSFFFRHVADVFEWMCLLLVVCRTKKKKIIILYIEFAVPGFLRSKLFSSVQIYWIPLNMVIEFHLWMLIIRTYNKRSLFFFSSASFVSIIFYSIELMHVVSIVVSFIHIYVRCVSMMLQTFFFCFLHFVRNSSSKQWQWRLWN